MSHGIAVLGAGSFGTALAIQFARSGRRTRLWGRDPAVNAAMRDERCNAKYLPAASFPDTLEVCDDIAATVAGDDDILIVVPSHAFRSVLEGLQRAGVDGRRIAWATKGLELATGKLPHQVAAEVLGRERPLAVLSGPTFAAEVGRGLPTALTVASNDTEFGRELAESISDGAFRAYTSDDIVGVEVGGAVKNVLAIGAGLSDGLGFGANTRIAVINRGLIEMTRFGIAMGATESTFMGLAGMGDLVLTCTDDQSRNRRMGLALAAGKTVAEAEADIQQVVEGVVAAKAVYEQSQRLGVEMPIVEQIYKIIYDGVPPADAVRALMSRPLRPDADLD